MPKYWRHHGTVQAGTRTLPQSRPWHQSVTLRERTYLNCTALQYSYIVDIFSSTSLQEVAVKPKASRISLKNVPVSGYVKAFG